MDRVPGPATRPPAALHPFPPTTRSPSMKDNYLFIKEVKNLVNKAGCDLKVCFGYINRGDRWMQVGGHRAGGHSLPSLMGFSPCFRMRLSSATPRPPRKVSRWCWTPRRTEGWSEPPSRSCW